MKKIVMAIAALVLGTSTMAQENRFSAGLELAFPMGDWAEFTGMGIGGTLGFELPVGDNLGLVAQAGYMSFAGKDIEILGFTVEAPSVGVIPIQVGAKYYFQDNQEGVYAGLLTGIHMTSVTVETTSISSSGAVSTSEETETSSNFGIAPMLGIFVTENIDIALRYQMLFAKEETATIDPTTFAVTIVEENVTNSYIGIRAAYTFGGR